MKSIVEEASSIAKAIENGWVRAGKPQEFTVRIYEESEKNFIGMTKRPAKVGIVYKESIPPVQQIKVKEPRHIEKRQTGSIKDRVVRPERQIIQKRSASADLKLQQKLVSEPSQTPKWTPEMVGISKEILSTFLNIMGKGSISVTSDINRYRLILHLSAPILEDSNKEQLLLRNLGSLLLQATRQKLRRGLRGYRIVITGRA